MIGCVAAVICDCIIGAVYYHPSMPTGKVWMKRLFPGKDAQEISAGNQFAIGLGIIVNVVWTLLLKFLLSDTFGAASPLDGLKIGVGLCCLVFLLELPHTLFSKRSLDVFIIEQIHNFLIMAASGTLVAYFG